MTILLYRCIDLQICPPSARRFCLSNYHFSMWTPLRVVEFLCSFHLEYGGFFSFLRWRGSSRNSHSPLWRSFTFGLPSPAKQRIEESLIFSLFLPRILSQPSNQTTVTKLILGIRSSMRALEDVGRILMPCIHCDPFHESALKAKILVIKNKKKEKTYSLCRLDAHSQILWSCTPSRWYTSNCLLGCYAGRFLPWWRMEVHPCSS